MTKASAPSDSFIQWVEAYVLPLRRQHPTWWRLDGWDTREGNLEVVGYFRHLGRTWQVHGDTRFAPILRAYEAIRSGKLDDPFVVEPTRNGACLNLKPEIRPPGRAKYFYVYQTTARRG